MRLKIQLQFFIFRNKQKVLVNTHMYMHAAINVMFTKIQAFSSFKMFGEIAVAAMVKDLKQLD